MVAAGARGKTSSVLQQENWRRSGPDRPTLPQRLGFGIAPPGGALAGQALFTCAFVAAFFAVNGYQFGGADHAIHFPFIQREFSSDFLTGDPLVDRAQYHPSFLWSAVAALLHVARLKWIYLGLYAVSSAAMFSGVAALARALSPARTGGLAGILAAGMVLFIRFSGAGIASFDIMVLNRTVSLGPLLYALALAAQGRYRTAFLLIGLTFNIHATTAVHAAILVWFGAAFGPGRLVHALRAPLWFLLGAAPLLIRTAATGGAAGVPFLPPQDWLDAQRLLLWFHHFPSYWPRSYWLALLPPLAAIAISLLWKPSRIVLAYLSGIAAACLAGFVGVEILHLPILLQLHLQEILRFLPYLAAASLAAWAAASWSTGSPRARLRAAIAVGALALDQAITYPASYTIASSASFWILLAILGLEAWRPQRGREPKPAPLPSLGWILGVVSIAAIGGFCYRRLPILPTYASHYESRIAAWSRANLPESAIVAIPPYYYLGNGALLNFRWAAGRRILVSLKDGGETTFSMSYFQEWRRRIEDQIGHPLDFTIDKDFRFHRDQWVVQAVADYGTADSARFRLLAARYGVTHAIVEADAAVQPDLPLLYQDERYRLYEIPAP